MTGASALDRLAEAHGIEPGYIDIWGKQHAVGDDTKRALLAAMGVPADTDSEIETGLLAAEAEPFSRLTPAVMVLRTGEPIALPLALEAMTRGGPRSGERLRWSIITEDGARHQGQALVEDLCLIDQAEIQGSAMVRRALPLASDLPPGYHRCRVILEDGTESETELILAPTEAFWPSVLDQPGGLAGVTAPLYGLRSARNAGIGDFADLGDFAAGIAARGAGFAGINPAHALFPSQPHRISPYAPSSRRFLNVLLIALDQVPEFAGSPKAKALLQSPEAEVTLDRLRAADLVDYPAVTALKLRVLEALFATFSALPPSSPRRAGFETFRRTNGQALERHARFEAIAEHLLKADPASTEWRQWPESLRAPESPAVQDFAERHAQRVTFYAYLQWLAASQLEEAQARAVDAGMALGLYLDLAVGVAPDGAEAWSDQTALVDAVRIGAPPDDFNPGGQNWGLLPLSPKALRARGYGPFIELLRQNMRHAGALRIDHVLGLARSYWLPFDRDVPGAYVRYPLRDLLGLIALESVRQRCVVIGEDLGTVPESLRAELESHRLLGCRLLYFERNQEGASTGALAYPKACIASISTHDLPTLAGFWQGRDIEVRDQLGLFATPDQADRDRADRKQTLTAFLRLLDIEGLLPEGIDPNRPPPSLPWPLVLALHRFLSRTPAALKAIQLEDAIGAVDQPNLPGTVDQYPNWRRKLGPPLERLDEARGLAALLRLFALPSTSPGTPAVDD